MVHLCTDSLDLRSGIPVRDSFGLFRLLGSIVSSRVWGTAGREPRDGYLELAGTAGQETVGGIPEF